MAQDPFINKVGTFLSDFAFEAYWPNKSIDIADLKTTIKEPVEVQIDIVAKIGSIGFLIEVTTQKEKNEDKIKKFISKYRAVKDSTLPNNELMNLFPGIPPEKKETFYEIKEWRAVYMGTSIDLVYKEIRPDEFTDSEGLTIINIDDWNYITALKKAIGKYARFEFISFLGLNPDEVEDIKDCDEYFDFHRVKERNVTNDSLKAEIFLFDVSPDFLLRTCRVFRFVGLPLKDSKLYYQRMLNQRKLNKIREFIGNSPKRSFPTPITVVLPSKAKPKKRNGKNKLSIPIKYGSLDVIDGQHRLYAYASPDVSQNIREKAKLLVNGIKFKTDKPEEIKQLSARTFIDINREQTKVKTSLLYLIGYDVMGVRSDEYIAGKIISLCTQDKNSSLYDLFEGRVIRRKSKLGIQRTSIVEVTNALANIIRKMRDPDNSKFQDNIAKMLGKDEISTKESEVIKFGKKLVNKYFNRVKNVLPNDWEEETESVIFRSKYMATFIHLLLDSIEKGYTFTEIEKRLKKISDNLKSNKEWKDSAINIASDKHDQIFHRERHAIPPVKFGTGKILMGLMWYENSTNIWPELKPSLK